MQPAEISLSSDSLIGLIKATLAKGASFKFTVKGFSMSPFIRNGDVATISALGKPKIDFGQVVAFINPLTKKLVIHRVVGWHNGACWLKGDAMPETDGLIPTQNILGVVNRLERPGTNIEISLGRSRIMAGVLSKSRILSLMFYIRRLLL